MKVKGIISEERVTLPEMREVLLGVESQRIAAEKEMSYEFGAVSSMPINLQRPLLKKHAHLWRTF